MKHLYDAAPAGFVIFALLFAWDHDDDVNSPPTSQRCPLPTSSHLLQMNQRAPLHGLDIFLAQGRELMETNRRAGYVIAQMARTSNACPGN